MTKRRQKISEAVRAELIDDLNKLNATDREKEIKRFNALSDRLRKRESDAPRMNRYQCECCKQEFLTTRNYDNVPLEERVVVCDDCLEIERKAEGEWKKKEMN